MHCAVPSRCWAFLHRVCGCVWRVRALRAAICVQAADGRVFLVYGSTGWLGGRLVHLLREAGETVAVGTARIENREALIRSASHPHACAVR